MNRWEILSWCLLVGCGTFLIFRSWPAIDLGTLEAPGLVAEELEQPDGRRRRYVLYVPREYDGVRALPLIVFLHGLGEIGYDGRRQLKAGLAPVVWSRHRAGEPFPYFVLFPQARDPWIADSQDGRDVIKIIDKTLNTYVIDLDRVYLTGVSIGGEGVLDLAAAYPDRWAAVVPIACMGLNVRVDRIKSLPVRWYQNRADSIEAARSVAANLNKVGGSVELIEFDDLGHDAWTRAYADPGLYAWLNRQVRGALPIAENGMKNKVITAHP